MSSCIFCQIIAEEMPSHQVWDSETHLGFLSIFPNTDGVTVVIPKEHLPSYIFENSQADIDALMAAAKAVAKKIDRAFDDVGRTGVIFEGFGVDHLHAKLYPMHSTGLMDEWRQIESEMPHEFFSAYPGYLSSHDCQREDDAKLAELAQIIRTS